MSHRRIHDPGDEILTPDQKTLSSRGANKVHPMQQRPLGRSGLAVSRLALGTMTWGRDTDPDDAAAQLKLYLEAGGTLLDTADVYGDGDAESVIGSLLETVV